MFVQTDRPLKLTKPFGDDTVLLVGMNGEEGLSRLFRFHLDLVTEAPSLDFDKLLGQKATVELELPDHSIRHFSGIISRLSQRERDTRFTYYRAELVPQFWLWTRSAQSRIFQHLSVPDILKKVLAGLDVAYEIAGTFDPRDYVVQYRETDFEFAARLMEEEGIYYYFKHAEGGEKMVVANTPQSHADLVFPDVEYEEMSPSHHPEDRIFSWEKIQELRSGKCTLWDHCFELPHKHLEAEKSIPDSVTVGRTTHKLKVGPTEKLEIYDYPGEYAQRFDGIDKGGGDKPAELQKIFEDNQRTVSIRMQAEATAALVCAGSSTCRQLVSGHKFTLHRHFSDDGPYVLTSVRHQVEQPLETHQGEAHFKYENQFDCIPAAVPFRPARATPRPTIHGTQTAVVVGPPGEEIFTDKYSRVKVQFHWDREGKSNADSSCWIRVATTWAGKQWGVLHIPRIGQEVVVAFEEGDPDRPIIVGSVYNADTMPAYTLPDQKTKSYWKSLSSKGGQGFNEIRFDDTKGTEQIFVHGERNLDVRIKHDAFETIDNNSHLVIKKDYLEHIQNDHQVTIDRDGSVSLGRDHHLKIGGKEAIEVGQSRSVCVKGDVAEDFKAAHSEKVGTSYYLKAMNIVIEASTNLTLKVGGNCVVIDNAGVSIKGSAQVVVEGALVRINSGPGTPAAAGSPGSLVPPSAPKAAEEADKADPGEVTKVQEQQRAQGTGKYGAPDYTPHNPNKAAIEQAAAGGGATDVQKKKSWIEIKLVDKEHRPIAGEFYRILLPDGTTAAEGTLDENGYARVDGFDPGTCKVTFPRRDRRSWKPKD